MGPKASQTQVFVLILSFFTEKQPKENWTGTLPQEKLSEDEFVFVS